MGIDVERVVMFAFALSGFLAGIAGIMVAPLFTISSTMGTLFGIKAFAVAILGGIGNAWGVVVAGLIYGVAEALIIALAGSTYSQMCFRPRYSRAGAAAERLVRSCRGQESMKLAVIAVVAGLCAFIWRANGYELYVLALLGLTTIVGVGLNVLLGMSGQISLGHAAFYAIGAYVVAIFTTKLDWTVWAALPLAGLIAGVAGVLLAIPALRVRGPYLAMVTIAFGFVLEQGSAEWETLTGGWNGLLGIPMPSVAGFAFSEREMVFPILAFTLLSLLLYARLSASPWGKAMRAVRDAEVASQSIGIDPTVDPSGRLWHLGDRGRDCRRHVRLDHILHKPESFPFLQSIFFCWW